jgi:hypothetical protein
LIRENVTPPHNFQTSRQRELRERAHETWEKQQQETAALELAYGRYLDDTIEQHIRKNYSKEFYSSAIRSKLAQLLSQNRQLKQRWNDETLHRIAEKRLRQEIAARLSLMSFQEFRKRQQNDSDQQRLTLSGSGDR